MKKVFIISAIAALVLAGAASAGYKPLPAPVVAFYRDAFTSALRLDGYKAYCGTYPGGFQCAGGPSSDYGNAYTSVPVYMLYSVSDGRYAVRRWFHATATVGIVACQQTPVGFECIRVSLLPFVGGRPDAGAASAGYKPLPAPVVAFYRDAFTSALRLDGYKAYCGTYPGGFQCAGGPSSDYGNALPYTSVPVYMLYSVSDGRYAVRRWFHATATVTGIVACQQTPVGFECIRVSLLPLVGGRPDAVKAWCKKVRIGNASAAMATQTGDPPNSGVVIGKPYTIDGREVVDWTWPDGVILSWHDGYVVWKWCG